MIRIGMSFSLLALFTAGTLLAQFRPTPGGHGSVLYPGTGGPPSSRPTYGGAPAVRGPVIAQPPAVRHPSHHPRTVIVPYPVYYGGGYYSDPTPYIAPPPEQAPPGSAYARGETAPPPVVIINQGFRPEIAQPVFRDYSNVPLPQPGLETQPQAAAAPVDDTPSYYLFAMKDRSIVAAIAYWVDGDTLHYITQQGDQNRISLDLVDREFSKQLNRDRRIELKLPGK